MKWSWTTKGYGSLSKFLLPFLWNSSTKMEQLCHSTSDWNYSLLVWKTTWINMLSVQLVERVFKALPLACFSNPPKIMWEKKDLVRNCVRLILKQLSRFRNFLAWILLTWLMFNQRRPISILCLMSVNRHWWWSTNDSRRVPWSRNESSWRVLSNLCKQFKSQKISQ